LSLITIAYEIYTQASRCTLSLDLLFKQTFSSKTLL
jgi:hypothetical protein